MIPKASSMPLGATSRRPWLAAPLAMARPVVTGDGANGMGNENASGRVLNVERAMRSAGVVASGSPFLASSSCSLNLGTAKPGIGSPVPNTPHLGAGPVRLSMPSCAPPISPNLGPNGIDASSAPSAKPPGTCFAKPTAVSLQVRDGFGGAVVNGLDGSKTGPSGDVLNGLVGSNSSAITQQPTHVFQ